MDKVTLEGLPLLVGSIVYASITAWNRYHDKRRRNKDKAEAAALVVATAASAAATLARHTEKVLAKIDANTVKIEANTVITEENGVQAQKAYCEANNFKERAAIMQAEIARLHQQIADLMRRH